MRHDHLKRELDLLLLLTQNRQYTTAEICRRTGISMRSFYYYIEFFEQAGFRVERHGGKYCIDRSSWFFTQLYDLIQFTEDEALLMRQLLENASDDTPRLRDLHAKFDRFYDFKILADERLRRRMTHIRSTLYDAVKTHRVVEIRGYSSPSSHTVSDRRVEPFQFLSYNNDIRCYEIATGKNKTFRLSRMEAVVKTDETWMHEDRHKQVFSDMFAFTGEKVMHVTLVMGQLSHNVMTEEYPDSASSFTQLADGSWHFETDVCSYLGVGRFIIGLYDDITIVGDDGLRQYVNGKIQLWAQKKCS